MSKNDPVITESSLRTILDETLNTRFKQFAEEIGEVFRDFADHIDNRLNVVEKDIKILKKDVGQLKKDVKTINSKLDVIEIANQSRDNQLLRHDRWHHQTAHHLQMKLN
jgi:septal ring factor EnvC (AmiA/AmiB activator)